MHKLSFYERYVKRVFDFTLSGIALAILSPVFAVVAVLVRTKLGSPVIFSQMRPGKIDKKSGKEKIFRLYKFRTMTDEKDEKGNLLQDEVRLTEFGKWLRSTSLDELPELWNILKGDMSIVGPRPQLVRDMVFMTPEQRKRHMIRQGLTGLAQVNGRNNITWEEKIQWDLQYIEHITFSNDCEIIFKTILKVFAKEGITEEGESTATDLGDYLYQSNKITKEEYEYQQNIAKDILREGG